MSLIRLFTERRTQQWIVQQAEQLAQAVLAGMREAVADRVVSMTPAEARGYLRARATPLMRAAAHAAVAQAGRDPDVTTDLALAATNRLLERLAGSLERTTTVRRAA